MQSIVTQLSELGSHFSAVATGDPISTVLVAMGALLFVASFGLVGYLALGAAVDLVIPDRIGRRHRRGA